MTCDGYSGAVSLDVRRTVGITSCAGKRSHAMAWGETWNNGLLQLNRRVASAGGGVRLSLTGYAEFDVIGGSRFVLNPSGASVTPLRTDAAYWRVIVHF